MNKFIQFEYHEKASPSTNDYKSDEILSLDTALQPVLSRFDQLDQLIKKAKKFRHHPSEYGLTEDESAAVYLYTDDCDGQSLHRVLDQALQSEDQTAVKPWLGFLKLLQSALEKLPTVKDTVWRRLPTNIAKQLKDNEEVICWGVTSCSMSADIIESIHDKNSVLCSIKPLNGKNIHGYTPVNDYEVLLLPGTRLRVIRERSNHEEQKSVIYLEEISDVDEEQTSSSGVTIIPADKFTNEEDIKSNDHLEMKSTTSTNKMNNEFLSNNEKLKENETKVEIIFSNGALYKLTYQNGKKQSYGRYYSIDGDTFEHQAADNKANGEGICAFKNGDRFIGTFKRGSRHGHGILYSVDGSIQAGNWANDEPITQSIKIMSNSGCYEWKDARDKERWYGAYLDNNGNKYIGHIVNGKAEGLGIRIWHDNSRYEGNFKNDKKHGYGICLYNDSTKYKGQWTNDKINGNGKLVWNSGTKYRGQFVNGKRHGQGKLTLPNGKIQEGKWQNDKYVQPNAVSTSSNR